MSDQSDNNLALSPHYVDVYGDDENWFFSDAVTRDFGINCHVLLTNGSAVFTSVQPANNYVKKNLPVVGRMKLITE